MARKQVLAQGVAVLCVFFVTVVAASAQNARRVQPVQVPQGTKQKVQGVVSVRDRDTFRVRDPAGKEDSAEQRNSKYRAVINFWSR